SALSLLIESTLATGRLSPTGEEVLRSALLRHLRNRLYMQAHLERRPHAADTPLDAPLIVTGLPRTGTTLLHNLLAQDPRHRFLPLWRALHPVPEEAPHGPDEVTLAGQAETWLERFYAMVPGFRAIHGLTPCGPEECDALLQNAFASQHFDDMFDAEAYSRWFYETDLDREYAYYALQLRLLTPGREANKRWVLKSPGHLGQLDALRRALPGARIVHCHRDPARAAASYASLIITVRRPNSEPLSPERIGEQALWRGATAMTRALRVRAGPDDGSFFDVSYADLVAHPIATVTRIYEWLGAAPLDPVAETAMRRWVAENPPDRHGAHSYDPRFFDLPADRVRSQFVAYLDRFEPLCASAGII
ncbi:MAG TPA: sulfotransferase, partial [Solirubrobacteraceae bacterium]|nr:sulfotransferase [Solirubrobacteraceae bacterium]